MLVFYPSSVTCVVAKRCVSQTTSQAVARIDDRHSTFGVTIANMPFPIGGPLERSLNPAVFETLGDFNF